VGLCYRLIVILVNMLFGILSGIQPLLMPVGSLPAYAQTACILVLQLVMSFICFRFLPDADRIFSRFAGTQFLVEGLATGVLLVDSISAHLNGYDDGETGNSTALWAFWISMTAMLLPITQLLEQRFVTPSINFYRNKGGNVLVLCATAYMIAASLPRKIKLLVEFAVGGAQDAQGAADSATAADAEDDIAEARSVAESGGSGDAAVMVDAVGGGGDGDGGGGGDSGDNDSAQDGNRHGGRPAPGASVGISGEQAANTVINASKLLARGVAAKEVAAKNLAAPGPPPPQAGQAAEAALEPDAAVLAAAQAQGNFGAALAVGRMRQRQSLRKKQEEENADDDGGDDGDGGGDDF